MNKRVKFYKGFQKKFINNLKIKSNLNWKNLANKLHVNENTLSKAYMFELCDIPYSVFKKIVEIFRENENEILKKYNAIIKNEEIVIGKKCIGKKKKILNKINITYSKSDLDLDLSKINYSRINRIKKINLPNKMIPELAEEIGMHYGDGFLSSKKYTYRLKGNIKDEKEYYINYIKPLFKKLYNIDVNLKEFDSVFGFEIYSQALCEFKIKVLGIRPGNKLDLHVPDKLKVDDIRIMSSFLRGLMDTDGCLFFKTRYGYNKYYPVIGISLKSKKVIYDVGEMFKMLGFNPNIYFNKSGYGIISINGIDALKKYEKLIGWSSQKNLNKLNDWKNRYSELYRD